jgi:hypothetical protein
MKKYLHVLVVIVSFVIITILPAKGYAGWVLYDDFEEGSINTELWDVENQSAATISVESGKAKFVHDSSDPHVSNWLKFKNPDQIKAVRVTVKVTCEPCGDVRARIGGLAWEDDEGYFIFQGIQISNQYNIIDTFIFAMDMNYTVHYRLFQSQFRHPINIIGEDFTVEMYFGKRIIEFKASGLGSAIFIPQQRMFRYDGDARFKGIGTRNNLAANCYCTVYFDDVYVIYKRFWK